MTHFGREICIIGTYSPTNDASENENDKYWDGLRVIVENTPSKKKTFLLRDLSALIGKRLTNNVIGKFGKEIRNDNGKRLIEICKQSGLKIQNTLSNVRTPIVTYGIKNGRTRKC